MNGLRLKDSVSTIYISRIYSKKGKGFMGRCKLPFIMEVFLVYHTQDILRAQIGHNMTFVVPTQGVIYILFVRKQAFLEEFSCFVVQKWQNGGMVCVLIIALHMVLEI